MNAITRKEYKVIEGQEEKVFNLVLKNTIEKLIQWEYGQVMYIGIQGNNKLLFYKGPDKSSISVKNKMEYVFFYITYNQEKILRNVIDHKNIVEATKKLTGANMAIGYYEGVE